MESDQVALKRGRLDAVIAGACSSWPGWPDGDGVLVTVHRSKTNQEGERNDVRFIDDGRDGLLSRGYL